MDKLGKRLEGPIKGNGRRGRFLKIESRGGVHRRGSG